MAAATGLKAVPRGTAFRHVAAHSLPPGIHAPVPNAISSFTPASGPSL